MSKDSEKYLGFIRDLAYLLRERAAEAQSNRQGSKDAFEDGREFGIRQALAWMQHEADAFGIPRDQVCLSGFEAMTDDVKLLAPGRHQVRSTEQ